MSELTLTPILTTAQEQARRKVVPRFAQRALIVLLATMYGGGFLFLVTISPLLLYSFYVSIAALMVMRVESVAQFLYSIKAVAPYLAWLIAFWSWGVLVSPFPAMVFGEVVRVEIRNLLFLVAVAVSLTDARSYSFFARLVQVAIFVNFLIALRQLNDPHFALDFARLLGDNTYTANNVRPAGLWINPDEAAFALLFGLLIIARERGPLVWLARAAAVYTMYLTASRTGNYILVLFFVCYLVFRLSQRIFSFRQAMVLVNIAVIVYAVWLALFYTNSLPKYDTTQDFAISRILDFEESNTDYTRGDLTSSVYQLVLQAPWYGYGAMSLQNAETSQLHFQSALSGLGAHNIYLAVWGETGLFGLISYLAVLGIGLSYVLRTRMDPHQRLIIGLMWVGYLIRGLTWHSQFLSGSGIVIAGILFCFPQIVQHPSTVDEDVDSGRRGGGRLHQPSIVYGRN